MKSEEIADWQWLTSDGADSYLRKAREHAGPLHQLISQLRKSLSDVQARLVTQQVELRRRAAQKFSLAGRMLFTSKLLEQSTDEVIALYKASRFPTDAAVHDICCGIGGDLMALLSRGAVVGVDQDPVATLLARHNAQLVLHGEDDAAHAFESTSIDDVTVADLSADWVHIDPDRRPGDQQLNADQTTRVTAWEYLQPGPDVLQTLRDKSRGVAIKIAAATSPPEDWEDVEREWIGSRGECRQQVLWCGELARVPGGRVATVFDRKRTPYQLVGDQQAELSFTDQIGQYIIEPHAAVLAADLASTLATELGADAIASNGGYLTGPQPARSALAASFEVMEQMPLDTRKLRQMLKSHQVARLEVKRRGIDETPDRILKRLKWRNEAGRGSSAVHTLIVTRLEHQVMTALCRRLELPF